MIEGKETHTESTSGVGNNFKCSKGENIEKCFQIQFTWILEQTVQFLNTLIMFNYVHSNEAKNKIKLIHKTKEKLIFLNYSICLRSPRQVAPS
jgi:hypothetical protein